MVGPSLQFSHVHLQLGAQDILSDVSLTLGGGQIHAIVGPNGGGKTSLVRALLGQMPFTGKITIEGAIKPIIGYAPQSLDLDRTLPFTVLDVLAVMQQTRPAFLGRSAISRQAQDDMLERVGLAVKAKRLFGYLSGGERQRLLFAQALLPRPDLLIMDEPTSNMDLAGSHLVEAMVSELAQQGVTIIWVNHDWEQVRRIAHTVSVINRRVQAHGPAQDIMKMLMQPEPV